MIDKDENEGSGVKCRSVAFGKLMSDEVGRWGANCWLKNGTKQGGEWGFKGDWYAYAERVDQEGLVCKVHASGMLVVPRRTTSTLVPNVRNNCPASMPKVLILNAITRSR